MTRRRFHSLVGLAITFPAVALGWYFVIQAQAIPFLVTSAVYCALLLTVSLLLRSRVPVEKRLRPDPPPQIAVIKVGLCGEALTRVVRQMRLTKTKTIRCLPFFRPQRHDLFEASETSQNGDWTWWVETARERLVGYAVSYKSHESPTLDTGWGHSQGRVEFVNTSS